MLEPDLDSTLVLAVIGFALLVVSGVPADLLRRSAARLRRRDRSRTSALPARCLLAFLHPWKRPLAAPRIRSASR